MMNKRLGIIALLSLLLIFPVSASMVSFLLVETGISDDVPNSQYTSLWEGGLMAAFFDAGHIVTNGPAARMEKKPLQDFTGVLGDDFNEAVEGGAEYFVLGFLEYQMQGGNPVLLGIALKLYDADSQKLIYEQRFPAGNGKTLDEEYRFAQDAGRSIISHLSKR